MATHDYPATSSSGPDISGTPSAGNYARFADADTLEARTTAQVLSDIGGLASGSGVERESGNWTLASYAKAIKLAAGQVLRWASNGTSELTSAGIRQSTNTLQLIAAYDAGGSGAPDGAAASQAVIVSIDLLNYLITLNATLAASLAGNMKLDDLATPDDNTDLNASSTRHGLLPKLSNVATEFLTGTGTWAAVGAPAAVCADAYLASDNNMSSGFSFNSWNTLTGWTSRLDTNSFYTTDDWTIPSGKAGFYLVTFICAFTPGTTGYGLRTQVYVNGAAVTGAPISPSSSNSTSVAETITWTAILDLEVGDVLTARVRSDNDNDPGTIGGGDTTAGRTTFELAYLGA